MIKTMSALCLAMALLSSAHSLAKNLSPHEIISSAPEAAWRKVDPEQVLRLSLATGHVYIELNPLLAPGHSDNMKKLAREGFYQGLSVYRFVEGFVAQGGDMSDSKTPKSGKKVIPAEFAKATAEPLAITPVAGPDGYATHSGFLNGFAVAQDASRKLTWQTHCTGVFAMARGNEADSGGTEFYVALTPQRYLDRNITVFGRVLEGMEHIQKLDRTAKAGQAFNVIKDMVVLADVKTQDNSQFRVMNTDSDSFKQLIQARAHRPEAWFIARPDYVDVCSVAVPTERL
ncbi:peptidylprolyl isomerase [Pseudoalteromonas fenneropenaei]|uniref:peptidylprolyl isomerase n=1 Tax=Pseudoalteromonas fenneropenaei TaxID=1737459 RepID=A0ABV7CI31_9GAMM